MSDFTAQFKSLAELFGQAAKGTLAKVDHWTFKLLVDQLKQNDYDVACEAINQLVKEKRLIAIPPLFFVAKMHPNPYVRIKADKALKEFNQDSVIADLSTGKPIPEATKILIDHYGNYQK